MITCSICGLQNDELAVLCSSCKSYLQSKVDSLNLFETIWKLIESPGTAFKRIALARHKNFVLVLSSLTGIGVAFTIFWIRHLGDRFENLLVLTTAGALTGIPLGLLFMFVLSLVVAGGIRLSGKKVAVRDSWAVVSYSGVPVVLSLVFIFPLEIAIFGPDFFGTNPPPMAINPGVYLALITFDALAFLWSVLLLHRGVMVMSGFRPMRSIAVTGPAVLFIALFFWGSKLL